ncbi:MAG: substrate-binding domain-containing protein [Treponema sp.]|nr:substrate-binding domain-containing protein [Treponema sp.]
MKKTSSIFVVLLMFTLAFTACAPKGDSPSLDGETGALKVGLSNTFMYPWRAQMIEDITRLFEYYKGKGWVTGNLIVQHAGFDLNAQIAQIRNMVNDGVNVLLINPMSADSLNEVVEEAVAKGVTVVAFDQEISARGVFNVAADHYAWGSRYAEWLANAVGREGEVVYIEGIPGHPANDARVRGWLDVLAKYPNIKIVGNAVGNWDYPGAQMAASQLLATNPNLKGILSMDGMGLGLFNALRSARKLDRVITTSETPVEVLKAWYEIREEYPNFKSFGVTNPPGIGATALGFGVRLAQGKTFKGELVNGNTYHYAIVKQVDENNFDDFYKQYVVTEGRLDPYIPDEWLSEEQLDALFE